MATTTKIVDPRGIVDTTVWIPDRAGGTLDGLTTGLDAWWAMEEATSAQRIDSHNSLVLGAGNGVTQETGKKNYAAGYVSASLQSSGLTPVGGIYVSEADSSGCCWFYIPNGLLGPQKCLWSSGNSTGDVVGYVQTASTTNELQFVIYNGSYHIATVTGAPAVDTWHFAYWEVDATAQTISLSLNNGTPVSASYGPLALPSGATKAFSVGALGGVRFWDGRVDEFAWWSRTLTSDEITGLYNSGAGITYTDL